MLRNGSSLGTPLPGSKAWRNSLRTLLVEAAWPLTDFGNATSAQTAVASFAAPVPDFLSGFQP
jgi:hypothetical protein